MHKSGSRGSEKQSVSISESSIDSPLFIDDDYDSDAPHQWLDEVVVSVGSVKSIIDHINFLENSKEST